MAPVTSSLEKADDMMFQVYEQEKIGREKVLKMEYQKHRLEAIAAQEKAKAEKAISAYWRQKNIDEAYQRRGEPLPPFTPPVMANSVDNLQLDNILVESDEDSNAERNQGCGSAFIICGSGSSSFLMRINEVVGWIGIQNKIFRIQVVWSRSHSTHAGSGVITFA